MKTWHNEGQQTSLVSFLFYNTFLVSHQEFKRGEKWNKYDILKTITQKKIEFKVFHTKTIRGGCSRNVCKI